jgi:ribosome-interacting GTPase 1
MVDSDRVNDETIKAILKEYRINSADICIKCDATEDDIIDIVEGNRKYIPCLYALNKIDALTLEELNILDQIEHYVPIAGDLGWNLDELIDRMWEYLDLIRVYTKPKGRDPDYNAPVILPRKFSRIEDFCSKIHRNMIKDFRYAMVWGSSVKFNPQKVGKDHQLEDEDVVQIIKKM